MKLLLVLISAIALLCSACPEKSQEEKKVEEPKPEEAKIKVIGSEGQKIKMIRKKDQVLNEVEAIMKMAAEKRDKKLGDN